MREKRSGDVNWIEEAEHGGLSKVGNGKKKVKD